ncbi:chorismate lyase [Vibrio sp. PP-XX7]
MEHVILPYLSVLNQINWQESSNFDFPNERVRQWLTEQGSLSRLMKAHCRTLSVKILQNIWLEPAVMTSEESMLLQEPDRFFIATGSFSVAMDVRG